jgi:phosphoribulokinase
MGLAMELVLTPLIKDIILKKRALADLSPIDIPI